MNSINFSLYTKHMRINKFIASATGLSRRVADKAVEQGNVLVNGIPAHPGQEVTENDDVLLNNKKIAIVGRSLTIMLNKPIGYVVSRNGQGSRTIYDLLPPELHHLKPVGRLDKDSSGLLLLTNDGQLAQRLTHPKYQKIKIYEVELNRPLTQEDKLKIEQGVMLEDGPSSLQLTVDSTQPKAKTTNRILSAVNYRVAMVEGRNRQIRRTFAALGYTVTKLHRTQFGNYGLHDLAPGNYRFC